MFTIAPPVPPRRVDRRRTASREHKIVPATFTPKTLARAALVTSSTRAKPPVTPALFTSALIGPNCCSAVWNMRMICCSSETSACTAMACPPPAAIASTTFFASASPVEKLTATKYPRSLARVATAAPIPRLPPVTMSVPSFPWWFIAWFVLPGGKNEDHGESNREYSLPVAPVFDLLHEFFRIRGERGIDNTLLHPYHHHRKPRSHFEHCTIKLPNGAV